MLEMAARQDGLQTSECVSQFAFAGPSANDDRPVISGVSESTYRAHEHIFHEGDDASRFYEVLEGMVCVYKIMADGRRLVLSFCLPGDLIGLGDGDAFSFSAEAMTGCRVLRIPLSAMEHEMDRRPELGRKLLRSVRIELSAARAQLLNLARKSAMEKIATFLIELFERGATRAGAPNMLRLPMNRADIADYLGLTIETVSRTFTKLRKMGTIDLPQSSMVVLRDIEQLKSLSER